MPVEIINDFVTISESARENEGTRRHINQIEYSSGNEFLLIKKKTPPTKLLTKRREVIPACTSIK